MKDCVEEAIEKHSLRLKLYVTKVIFSITIIVTAISIYLIKFTERDGVTTLSGQHISWDSYPYQAIGNNMLVVCIFLLVFISLYWYVLKSKLKSYL
jgi:multisubunit Na+/H+ antiporter MnhC subunit